MSRDALVVGINLYSDLPPLNKPANDAEAIAQLLETKGGFRVKRLPCIEQDGQLCIDDSGAIGFEQLQQEIVQLFNPEIGDLPETVLLFFAGHNLKDGFIAASDTNPVKNTKAISFQWLADLLQASPIHQQVVWIDSCFSGLFLDLSGFQNLTGLTAPDRCFITSARGHEEALDQGLLTQALLEALDYNKQSKDTPWVNSDTLTDLLEGQNKAAEGWQRFQFQNNGQSIVLTNEAFENKIYEGICPFKGLNYFDNDDFRFFKGRSKLTNELLEKTKNTNFLAVLGASGNGKSSIVRAGLLYQLRQTERWQILPIITPTAKPIQVLNSILDKDSEHIDNVQTELLVIDQFEEIFTLCQDNAEREQFFATLLTEHNKFCLMIVMRADFLDKCSQYEKLAKKIQDNQIIITPMNSAELEEVIVEPTTQVGLQIEPKLVSEMLVDLRDASGGLPLLQYTLKELWEKCADSRLLTFSAYEELGKIAGTLENAANKIYEELPATEQKVAKRIFIELTQLGEGSSDTSRQLYKQDLVDSLPFESNIVEQVIEKLVNENLLTTDEKGQEGVVNISHETLIQHWGQLRKWLDENRDAIKVQRDIEVDAKKFEDSHQSKDALLQGLDLSIAKNYAKTHTEKIVLSALALDFVERSVKRQRHYWQGVIGSVVGVILVLAGFGYYANEQRIEADEQKIVAENQRQFAQEQQKLAKNESQRANQEKDNALRGQSLFLADLAGQETEKGNATNGILLALEALPKDISNPDRPYVIEAEEELYNALFRQHELKIFLGHKDTVTNVKFSPNGDRVATSSIDGNVRLWDTHSGKLTTSFNINHDINHNIEYSSTLFVPNGECIAFHNDNTTYLWNINNGNLILSLIGNDRVIVSYNGQLMLTVKRGIARLWDNNCKQVAIFEEKIKHAAFSFNNQHMITISEDNVINLWKTDSKQKISTLFIKDGNVENVAISPDLQKIAVTSYHEDNYEGKVSLWDMTTNKQIVGLDLKIPYEPYSGSTDLTFCPDNQNILIGSWERNADSRYNLHFWNIDINTEVSILDFDFYNHSVGNVAIDSNCQKIVTITGDYAYNSPDAIARLWDIRGSKLITELRGHKNTIVSVDISQDDQYVITGSYDNTARLWSLNNNELVTVVEEVEKMERTEFNQKSRNLFTVSEEGIILDINSGKQVTVLNKYVTEVYQPYADQTTTIFSPDKQYVVTDSPEGGLARLWRVKNGELITTISEKSEGKTIFSHDSKYGITLTFEGYQSGGMIIFWKTSNGKEITTFYRNGGTTSIDFSSDSKRMAIGYFNGITELWDIKKLKPFSIMQDVGSRIVSDVSFSSDGQSILTIYKDDNANIWHIFPTTQALIDYARKTVPRQLTLEQRKQFFLE